MRKVTNVKYFSFMALSHVFILYCAANVIMAMPSMNSRKWRHFETKKIRDVLNSTSQNNGLKYHMSIITTNYLQALTSNYVMNRVNAVHNTNSLTSSTVLSTWNIPPSSTKSTTTSGENKGTNKQNNQTALIAVSIVMGGVIGLYLLYLSLLLSVAFWRYVFRMFNCYNYVELIE